MTAADFAQAHGITLEVAFVPMRPDIEANEWNADASHWYVTLRREGEPVAAFYFSQGSAFRRWKIAGPRFFPMTPADRALFGKAEPGSPAPARDQCRTVHECETFDAYTEPTPPDLARVLGCLALDCRSIEDARDFDDWADSLGIHRDSRKGERAYHAICKQAADLRRRLGPAAFADLLAVEE
jgi:hypothetical protein